MPGLPPVGERTLRAVYERVLATSPDEIAQVDESGAVTFPESYQRSLRLAAGLAAHGIGPQEPVALLLDNSLVERVINEHPAVFESAVVGVPCDLTEDEIKAVIVPRDGHQIDPVELTTFLVGRLPYFMVPRYLEFTAALPKTLTQKVHKHLLREGGTGPGTWDREAAGILLRRGSR